MAEVSFLAQAYHWPLDDLLDLEHPDRHRFIELVAQPGDIVETTIQPEWPT